MKLLPPLHFLGSSFFTPFLVLASLFIVSVAPVGAQESSPSATQERGNPEQPADTSNPSANSNQQSTHSDSKTTSEEKRDDRVYIRDIYPEYCRMYFHRRDWVSLFEYREGMYRCKHGNDRWW